MIPGATQGRGFIIRWLCALALLNGTQRLSGCINEYSTLLSGKVVFGDERYCPVEAHAVDREDLQRKLNSLDALKGLPAADPKNLNDRGVALIYLGRYDAALEQFRELLGRRFDPYSCFANMGTTFELMGSNDSALHYIRQAVAINQSAHDGSEWIHVKILEFKVALARGERPANILGIGFGDGELPVAPDGIDLDAVRGQLYYQLQERMTFVPPTDPIVGELLFELGNMRALSSYVECALNAFKLAREYGYTSSVFERRWVALTGMTTDAATLNFIDRHKWLKVVGLGLLLISPIVLIVLITRAIRWWKRSRAIRTGA